MLVILSGSLSKTFRAAFEALVESGPYLWFRNYSWVKSSYCINEPENCLRSASCISSAQDLLITLIRFSYILLMQDLTKISTSSSPLLVVSGTVCSLLFSCFSCFTPSGGEKQSTSWTNWIFLWICNLLHSRGSKADFLLICCLASVPLFAEEKEKLSLFRNPGILAHPNWIS